jgi:DNA replication protein DnaC
MRPINEVLQNMVAGIEERQREEEERWNALPEEEKQRIIKERRQKEEAEKREALIHSYQSKGIPPRFYNVTWENWIQDTEDELKAFNTVKNEAWRTNLFLCGKSGTGKTHLAMCLVKEGAVYKKLLQIFRKVKTDFSAEQSIVDFYGSVKLLILDEIGRQGFTPFEKTLFWDIIDTRWNNLLPTTLITNLDGKEFTAEYGTAILDRLRPVVVRFNWESRRESLNISQKTEPEKQDDDVDF